MVKVAVVGATGYTGIELCRFLATHPGVESLSLYSSSCAGKSVGEVFPHLTGLASHTYQDFSTSFDSSVDVVFLALGHGASHSVVPELLDKGIKVIDLSADYRLKSQSEFESLYGVDHSAPELLESSVYGLPELYAPDITSASLIANPGCYPTSVILALAPLKEGGLLSGSVLVDAKSGASGAGRTPKTQIGYCEVNEGLSAYGTFVHRHSAEMAQELGATVLFSPHLVPMDRGILSTIYLDIPSGFNQEKLNAFYDSFYADAPFVSVRPDLATPSTKYVAGSNLCMITPKVFEDQGKLVVFSAIDNLIKGASGQAVQNMNLMFGFDETAGLIREGWYL